MSSCPLPVPSPYDESRQLLWIAYSAFHRDPVIGSTLFSLISIEDCKIHPASLEVWRKFGKECPLVALAHAQILAKLCGKERSGVKRFLRFWHDNEDGWKDVVTARFKCIAAKKSFEVHGDWDTLMIDLEHAKEFVRTKRDGGVLEQEIRAVKIRKGIDGSALALQSNAKTPFGLTSIPLPHELTPARAEVAPPTPPS